MNFFSSLSATQTQPNTTIKARKTDVPKNNSIPKLPLETIEVEQETLSPKVSTFTAQTPKAVTSKTSSDSITFHNYIDKVLTIFSKKVNDSILFVTTFPCKYEVEIKEILVYDRFTGTIKHIIEPETVCECNRITITKMLQSKIDNRKLTRSITNNTILFTVPKLFRQKIPGKNIRCYFIDVHPPSQRRVLVH